MIVIPAVSCASFLPLLRALAVDQPLVQVSAPAALETHRRRRRRRLS